MNRLNYLEQILRELGHTQEADFIKSAISEGVEPYFGYDRGRPTKEGVIEGSHILLDLIGIIPGYGEIADLTNAAIYLAEGPETKNLFNAGISIISMIAGYGDMLKAIKYVPMTELVELAQKFIKNSDSIKAVFTRLKDPEVKRLLAELVPNGELLAKYSDQMFNSVDYWSKTITRQLIEEGARSTANQSL